MHQFPHSVSLRKKIVPVPVTSSTQLHQICGFVRVGQDFCVPNGMEKYEKKHGSKPPKKWIYIYIYTLGLYEKYIIHGSTDYMEKMNRYTLVEITDCMMLSNNNNDRRIGTQITQVRLADIWAWMKVWNSSCILNRHHQSQTVENTAQLYMGTFFGNEMMKTMIQENIFLAYSFWKNPLSEESSKSTVSGNPPSSEDAARPQVSRSALQGQALLKNQQNPHHLIMFHESSMKFATNIVLKLVNPTLMVVLNEKTIQHRFWNCFNPNSAGFKAQPRLGSFAGNARWRPPESAVVRDGWTQHIGFSNGYKMGTNEGNRTWTYLGLSENRVYSQWNSHSIGIMIIHHWVQWGTLFSDKPTWTYLNTAHEMILYC